MKTDARELPLIAVGGGAFLVPDRLAGISQVSHVPHGDCANAVGAAIAQVSGETDQVYRDLSRGEAIAAAEAQARERAIVAGAELGCRRHSARLSAGQCAQGPGARCRRNGFINKSEGIELGVAIKAPRGFGRTSVIGSRRRADAVYARNQQTARGAASVIGLAVCGRIISVVRMGR